MSYRVLVVDDERPARAKAIRLLRADDRFELAGEAANGFDALDSIPQTRPDVLLLDVQMPGLNGFEMLEAVGAAMNALVIFSTAFEEHALRAFEVHAVDYLLKPYDGARFSRALDKAWAQLVGGRVANVHGVDELLASAQRERIALRTKEGLIALRCADILRLEAANKHVRVYVEGRSHLVRQSLRALARRLGSEHFVRVHRSEVVRIDAVARFCPWSHGDGILILTDGSTVVLSRTYRKAFSDRFHALHP